tara:strand:- start:14859 stop:16340 length:1482 start_codon:yes stop_codon:yes gene_type:complete
MNSTHQFVVVGGGISGLYTACKLKMSYKSAQVIVFENSARLGGRIRSIYNKNHTFTHDAGAWRVSSNHNLMIDLAKTLNIHLVPTHSQPKQLSKNYDKQFIPQHNLSIKQSLLNSQTPQEVNNFELSTGYVGSLNGGRRSYKVHTNTHTSHTYYRPQHGMSEYINKLKQKCLGCGVIIECNCRVSKVQQTPYQQHKNYTLKVSVVKRDIMNSNKFEEVQLVASHVIFAVPPSSLSKIKVNFTIQIKPVLESITHFPLLRVYVKMKPGQNINKPFHIVTKDQLGHLISVSQDRFMVVYCGGWLCGWHQKLYYQNKSAYMKKIKDLYDQNCLKHPDLPVSEFVDFREPICLCHWESACHMWQPEALYNGIHQAMHNACEIHERDLRNVYVCGESCSSEQGWSEGAIETSNFVVGQIKKKMISNYNFKTQSMLIDTLIFNKRILDVSKWKFEHPGSIIAINNHLQDKDVTKLMLEIHNHTSQVWPYILALTIAYLP